MASNDPKGLAVLPFLAKQSDSETIYQAIGVRMDKLPMNPGAVLEATWEQKT